MIAAGSKGLIRLLLLAFAVASLLSLFWAVQRISSDPLIRPFAERGRAEFAAALERELARGETAPALAARLDVLLHEEPRNWIAIDAITGLAAENAIPLPPELNLTLEAAREEDSGILAATASCALCFWDGASCSLSQALICNAPLQLTPIGDLAGVSRAGIAWGTGGEIDQLDFALSAIGLGATATLLVSGGSSLTLKAGAGLLKTARKMALIPPRLALFLTDTARRGIRWEAVARIDTLSDPAKLLRPEVLRPAAALSADLGRISARLSPSETLHLLRYIDGPDDARRIAEVTETLGRKTIAGLEVIGKSRFLRAGLRFSDEAIALIAGLAGLSAALASAIGAALQSLISRSLRRALARR